MNILVFVNPKVSVIIPTYNRASMIIECIESVFNQIFTDFEIIIVDDGSSDNTEAVLRPYLDRITYIRQENKGNAAARNTGIEVAKGEFVAFLDSDDLWLPDKLEKQVRYLEDHPDIDMVCGNGVIFGNTKDAGRLLIPNKRAKPLEKNGVTLKGDFMKSSVRCSTIVIKKGVLEELGGFDANLRVCVDGDFSLRFLTKYRAAFMNEPLIRYRKHNDNISANREQRLLHSIKLINKLLTDNPELENVIGTENINKRLAYRYYRLTKTYMKKKKMAEARESIDHAVRLMPGSIVYRWYQFRMLLGL